MDNNKIEIEHKLLRRLKNLGLILIGFSLVALVYAFFPDSPEPDEELISELSEPPPMNMVIVTVVLASVGAGCVTIAWRKKNASNFDR